MGVVSSKGEQMGFVSSQSQILLSQDERGMGMYGFAFLFQG